MYDDDALEANRRMAWARFYRARADVEQVAWWAVEIAEYADAVLDGLPPEMIEVVDLVAARVSEHDRGMIRRYVRSRLRVAAA